MAGDLGRPRRRFPSTPDALAFYDSGVPYDSGALYDSIQKPKMIKVKLDLKSKTDDQLVTYCTNHKTKMAGNAVFPTPVPLAAVYDPALADFHAKLLAYRAALDTADQMRMAKDAARDTLAGATTQRGGYVEITAVNEAGVISAGFAPRAAAAPIGMLAAPQNVVATMGDLEGEVDVAWNRVRGAASYVVEYKLYNDPGAWLQAKIIPKSRVTVTGLQSGKKYSFRVRAVGAAGEGPWSDDAVMMAT